MYISLKQIRKYVIENILRSKKKPRNKINGKIFVIIIVQNHQSEHQLKYYNKDIVYFMICTLQVE